MKHLSEIELKQAFDRWYMAPKLRLPPVNKLNPLEAFKAGARWRESVGPDGEMFKQYEEGLTISEPHGKLIAAAPELLDACKKVNETLVEEGDEWHYITWCKDILEKAIKKAE